VSLFKIIRFTSTQLILVGKHIRCCGHFYVGAANIPVESLIGSLLLYMLCTQLQTFATTNIRVKKGSLPTFAAFARQKKTGRCPERQLSSSCPFDFALAAKVRNPLIVPIN
jgi:hypothetical protein